jgi:hypothetical protein
MTCKSMMPSVINYYREIHPLIDFNCKHAKSSHKPGDI